MRRWNRLTLVGAVAGLVVGCSSSTEPSLPNLVGTWRATKFEFVSVANSSLKEEFVSQATITMVITSTTLTVTGTPNGQAILTIFTGTYTETATALTVTGHDSDNNAETLTFQMSLNGSTLSLTGASTTHDFGSGDVPSYLNMTFTKQ